MVYAEQIVGQRHFFLVLLVLPLDIESMCNSGAEL